MKNRLIDIGVVGLLAVGLLACSGTSTANINAQALADAQGLLSTSEAIVSAIELNNPSAFTATQQAQIAASENAASAALTQLSTGTQAITGAMSLQQVDNEINVILTAVGAALPAASAAFPALAPFVPEYDAAVALLPAIETWVNTTIQNTQVTNTPVSTSVVMPLTPIKSQYSADQARKLLGIKATK